MSRDQHPPFERGSTYSNGEPIDANDLGGLNLEGKEFEFEDDVHGTGHRVRVRVVRNVSGGRLKPKKLVKFAAGAYGRRVDGYTTAVASHGFPADELLPPQGVAPNDLFYIVVGGPAVVRSTATGTPTVASGGKVVAGAAANQEAADAGTIVAQDLTGATATLGNNLQNAIGRAVGALAAGDTSKDVLIGVGW
jgi:hypothetical protein